MRPSPRPLSSVLLLIVGACSANGKGTDPCSEVTCAGHGTCVDGACRCETGFTGSSCEACATGYLGYPECVQPNLCEPDPCSGHGSCAAGVCSCRAGYAGAGCDSCAQGFAGYPDCTASACQGADCPTRLSQARVWAVAEYIYDQADAERALDFGADFYMRAWFKWANARDYKADRPALVAATAKGAIFGGGVTVGALYQSENGITQDEWKGMATRDPSGNIAPAYGEANIAHGSLVNQSYLDYVLRWSYAQIDAGVDSIFYDEVNGAYTNTDGFDEAAIRQFTSWLTRKYATNQGWTTTDQRWRDTFKIPLDNTTVCPDGTMASFDYRAYLKQWGWATDPQNDANPLKFEWGSNQDILEDDTYCGYRADAAWGYIARKTREYGKAKSRPIWVNANGINKHVDYQVSGMWIEWPSGVSTKESWLLKWRSVVRRGQLLAGAAVPVVFFHDWGGSWCPWATRSPAERMKWMQIYAPEIYAAGGFFGFDFDTSQRVGTPTPISDEEWAFLKRYASWYRRHADWFANTRWLSSRSITTSAAGLTLAYYERAAAKQRIVHIINHSDNYDANGIVPLRDVEVSIPSGRAPTRISYASPELDADTALNCIYGDGRLRCTIPSIGGYVALLLEYDALPTGDHVTETMAFPRSFWARPKRSIFTVDAKGDMTNALYLGRLVQGGLHPNLRADPVFMVNPTEPSKFVVRVGSVPHEGAILEIRVDGMSVLTANLPDRDGSTADTSSLDYTFANGEYNQEFSVPLSAGAHTVEVTNPGRDWLSVDYFALTTSGE